MRGCYCREGLREVVAAEEDFCRVLLEVHTGWSGFSRVKDSGVFKAKTWLCEGCTPDGLDQADVLGARVAKTIGNELLFGEVVEVCGFSRESRHLDQRVRELLEQPPETWRYTIAWAGATSAASREEVLKAKALASSIDAHASRLLADAEKRRQNDVHAALQRGQRAGTVREAAPRTRYITPTYDGLLSAMPAGLRRLMPGYQPSSHIVGSYTTETPAGTIHHSGNGLIFDLAAHNAESQTDVSSMSHVHDGFSWENMEAEYLRARPGLFHVDHDCFGFKTYDAAADFFTETWGYELDERGVACPCLPHLTAFDEWLLSLWRMRQRPSYAFLEGFSCVSHGSLNSILYEWIPQCGKAGRSWVWIPSPGAFDSMAPESYIEAGMRSVGLVGDATDIFTETVRAMISVRNQQQSDKSKHSCARGLTWCMPIGWTAIASDLVLGRSSEYATAVAIAPQFAAVPPRIALCYDKGVASLRAHLPNLNNVVVPCFLTGGQYTAEQAIRNRAIATNRYVVEVTYAGVKAWKGLQPVVGRDDFRLLNSVWWWALGFGNFSLCPLKRAHRESVGI